MYSLVRNLYSLLVWSISCTVHFEDVSKHTYSAYIGINLKISMWAYNLMGKNIVRSKYIFVENNKIEILFSNYFFGLASKVHLQSNLYLQ